MGVEGRVFEIISRSYIGICVEGLEKPCENLRQIIGDSPEIRSNHLRNKIQTRYSLKQLSLLLAVLYSGFIPHHRL